MHRFLNIKLLNLIVFFGLSLSGMFYAQSPMGGWTFHVSTSEVQQVQQVGNIVFSAYKNGILEFDLDSKEKSILHKINGLSDIEISCLGKVYR